MPADPAATLDSHAAVAIGRIQLALRGRGTARLVSMTGTAAAAVMLWPSYPNWLPLAWFCSGLALTLTRWLHLRRFARTWPAADSVAHWNRNIVVSGALYGALWGIACALLARSDTSFGLGAMAVVASGAILGGVWLMSIPRAFTIFALLVFVPAIVVVAASLTIGHTALAVFMSVALAGAIRLGGNLQQMIVTTLQLRQEKDAAMESLSHQTELAQASSRDKSRFLAAASHDLRQPLQALTMFTAALDPHVETVEARHLLMRAMQALHSLTELFDALLDVSRLDVGQIPMLREPVALGPMFEALREQFSSLAADKQLRLRVCPTDAAVSSDAVQLHRIVGNLVNNAITHTEHGSVCLCARRAGAAGSEMRIEVRDSGPGIPPGEHEAIFREFYQLANRERDRRKGLGLGLAIVHRVAQQLGHRISLRSAPGRGSVFGIIAPRAASIDAVPAAAADATLADDLRNLAVLVVDDEADVREAIAALLQRWGCEVWMADGLSSAVALLDSHSRPDVVLCDDRLRNQETGIGVIASLRLRIGEQVPAALISGDSGEESVARARAAGLPLLQKPVRPAVLRTLLRKAKRSGVLVAAAGG